MKPRGTEGGEGGSWGSQMGMGHPGGGDRGGAEGETGEVGSWEKGVHGGVGICMSLCICLLIHAHTIVHICTHSYVRIMHVHRVACTLIEKFG